MSDEFPAKLVDRVIDAMGQAAYESGFSIKRLDLITLAALREATSWQPMETAPEGAPVLIKHEDGWPFQAVCRRLQVDDPPAPESWVEATSLRLIKSPTGWQYLPPLAPRLRHAGEADAAQPVVVPKETA